MTYLDPLQILQHLELREIKAGIVQGYKVRKQKLDNKLISLTSKPLVYVPYK